MLLYYQIYHDWEEVVKMTGDRDGVMYLKPYVGEWIARDFMPDDYRFKYQPGAVKPSDAAMKLVTSLDDKMDALAVHNAIFEFGESQRNRAEVALRRPLPDAPGRRRGPRLGKLIAALGVSRVKGFGRIMTVLKITEDDFEAAVDIAAALLKNGGTMSIPPTRFTG